MAIMNINSLKIYHDSIIIYPGCFTIFSYKRYYKTNNIYYIINIEFNINDVFIRR